MDIFFPSFLPICFCFFLFLLMVMKLRNKSKPASLKLPPGPWKLPIIGNIHQVIGGLPHHTLRHLSDKHGPLMHLQLGQVSTVVISSPEMAMEVLKKHDVIFASRPHMLATDVMLYDYTDIAFAPYGAYWRQLRKICMSELFSVGRVQSFRHVRKEEVSDFIKSISLSAGKPVNLSEKIFKLTSGITSRAAFGKKSEEQEVFLSVIKEFLKLFSGFAVSDLFPSIGWLPVITGMKQKLEQLHREADKILENIINEHKRSFKISTRTGSGEEAVEDLIDVLLKYEGGANLEFTLTTDNVKAVILNIFMGGSETSSSTVVWAMAEMIKNPSVMKKVQAEVRQVCDRKGKVDETDFHELNYLKLVIKEILRLHPPAPLLLPRECGQTCEINGYQISSKTKVLVNAWAIGRDPNYWKNPETFNPERFEDSSIEYKGTSFEFIPFGAGRRICPGLLFGLVNVEHQLAELLYHFDWKLPNGMRPDDFDMAEEFSAAVKRKQGLVLIPIVYAKPSDVVG